jgi:hypothetical protein
LNTLNTLNNVYNERIRIVRETNDRAVKNKKGLLYRAVFTTKESDAPSAAYWYGKSAGGGYTITYGRKKRTYLLKLLSSRER